MNKLLLLPFYAVGGLLMMFPYCLRADDHPHDGVLDDDDLNQVWSVNVGALVMAGLVSPGIDKYTFEPLPYVDITYRGRYYLSVYRGLGATLVQSDGFTFDLALNYEDGRDESDARKELRGMGDIGSSAVATATAGYSIGRYKIGLNGEKAFGGAKGWRGKLSIEREWDLGCGFQLSASPYLIYADSKTMRAYYGVSAVQSARSGRAQYRPGSGLERCGIELLLMRQLGRGWNVAAMADFGALLGDARKSKLTTEDNQLMGAGLAVFYRF